VGDEIGNDLACVVEREGDLDADAIAFEGFVPAFDLAVGLWVIGRSPHMSHAGDADEFLEVLGDELGSVVADDAWRDAGEFFTCPLDDGFHVDFLHFFANFVVDDEAAVAIEERAEEIKSAGDVEVADIHVPLLMGFERLDEAGAFLGDIGRLPGEQSRFFEDAIDAGRAASNDVGIEHHEGHAAIPFERMGAGEVADAGDLVIGEPMIARDPGVVFVDFAEAFDPVLVLAAGDADPGGEARDRDVGFVGPGADEIDDLIARVVRDPTLGQSSPRLFF